MIDTKKLAELVTRDIFVLGDEQAKCWRIEFKVGTDLSNERPGGGMIETALAKFVKDSLDKHLAKESK